MVTEWRLIPNKAGYGVVRALVLARLCDCVR